MAVLNEKFTDLSIADLQALVVHLREKISGYSLSLEEKPEPNLATAVAVRKKQSEDLLIAAFIELDARIIDLTER